jgi:hypothetical protein
MQSQHDVSPVATARLRMRAKPKRDDIENIFEGKNSARRPG